MKASKKVGILGAVAALGIVGQLAMAAPVFGGAARVKATDSKTWSPKSKSVPTGTKVVWRNPSGDSHNVVSYKGAWSKNSSLPEGGSTSYKFGKAGTYKYRCSIHSELDGGKCDGMCGKIVVG